MKHRALLCIAPLVTCAFVFFACSGNDATTTIPGASEAGAVDARPQGPTTKPVGDDDDDTTGDDDDDDDDDDIVDAGNKPDASAPKDAGKDADAAPPTPPRKRVFVTKAKFTGDLKTAGGGVDGPDGADKICKAAADAANLGGTWVAWVSVNGKNAIDRIVVDTPWYLVNRTTLVFAEKAKLTSPPLHAIDMNETGGSLVAGSGGPLQNRVWTGTQNSGVEVANTNCANWTDGTTTPSGVVGAYRETASWSRYALDATEKCDKAWPIYCFEQ